MSREKTKSELCQGCGRCCEVMVLPLVKPLRKSEFENWLGVRGGKIIKSDNDVVYAEIYAPCPQLSKSDDGKFSCDIYGDHPDGCKIFDGAQYDFLDCAWKDKYVVLEKAMKCNTCGKTVTT